MALTDVTHYRIVMTGQMDGSAPVMHKCLEEPCIRQGGLVEATELDKHATNVHGSEHIMVS